MPLSVPATLQSMLPKWSSVPVGSVSNVEPLKPIDAPATGALNGTPQSCKASEAAQTDAIDVLPDEDATFVRTVTA